MAEQPREKMANMAAASLTDDLILDILSRLPVKSLCRCKCVSPHWRDLISDPDNRRLLPQTLAGFFRDEFINGRMEWRFTNLCETRQPPLFCNDPFSFMPGYEDLQFVDSCNSVLLFQPHPHRSPNDVSRYVVCNPSTKSWVVLPDSGNHSDDDEDYAVVFTALGFDPAVSPHFYVFEFVSHYNSLAGVEIYSSETGSWSYKEEEGLGDYDFEAHLFDNSESVFFNGILHFTIQYEVVAVDVQGESWWVIPIPEDPEEVGVFASWYTGSLGRYQGNLCYMNSCCYECDLSIWVLDDYAAANWVLKREVTIQQLTEKISPPRCYDYRVITIHPDCNWILYVSGVVEHILMGYDMDRDEVHVIQNLGAHSLRSCIPYVPFYAKSLTYKR